MTKVKLSLASDNHAPAHSEILRALMNCPQEDEKGYDQDSTTKKLFDYFRKEIGNFEYSTCANGTAANVLSIGSQLQSYECVLTSDQSHLYLDSCSAIERAFGIKVVGIGAKDVFLRPQDVKRFLIRQGDQHYSQPRLVSLTWPDERGLCQPVEQLKEWRAFADQNNLLLHLDGTRLMNGCLALNVCPRDVAQFFDSVSLGGSKNGLLGGEIFGVREPKVPLKYLRKQHLNLLTKSRYISIQFLRYFDSPLATEMASHSHNAALTVSALLKNFGIKILYPVETNMVFAQVSNRQYKSIKNKVHIYLWEKESGTVRIVTSWATGEQHFQALKEALSECQEQT